MRRPVSFRFALAALFAFNAVAVWGGDAAGEEELVTGISSDTIEVTSNFTGTRVVIFGTVEQSQPTDPEYKKYDLVIVLRGPSANTVVRRKERTLGIWVNRAERSYEDLPSSYMVVSTQPLSAIAEKELLEKHRIGISNLPISALDDSTDRMSENEDFRRAFGRLKTDNGLYAQAPGQIEFLSRSMFRAAFEIPSNIPIGIHNLTTYLFSEGELVATEAVPLVIKKTGFERFAFTLAHENPLIYGIAAVILAIATGWMAGVIFGKN